MRRRWCDVDVYSPSPDWSVRSGESWNKEGDYDTRVALQGAEAENQSGMERRRV